jgi:hypothetical protein
MNDTMACWSDPLSRKERTLLARKLARACRLFYAASMGCGRRSELGLRDSLLLASKDMSDLHLDVTERAEVPTS